MRSKLSQRIKNWRRIQALYMPVVSTLLVEGEGDGEGDAPQTKPELGKLWMPSELDEAKRTSSGMKELEGKELKLRESEARDALHQVSSDSFPRSS